MSAQTQPNMQFNSRILQYGDVVDRALNKENARFYMAQNTECISEVYVFIMYFAIKEINLYNLQINNKIKTNK